jgi:hypothetical protein
VEDRLRRLQALSLEPKAEALGLNLPCSRLSSFCSTLSATRFYYIDLLFVRAKQ